MDRFFPVLLQNSGIDIAIDGLLDTTYGYGNGCINKHDTVSRGDRLCTSNRWYIYLRLQDSCIDIAISGYCNGRIIAHYSILLQESGIDIAINGLPDSDYANYGYGNGRMDGIAGKIAKRETYVKNNWFFKDPRLLNIIQYLYEVLSTFIQRVSV